MAAYSASPTSPPNPGCLYSHQVEPAKNSCLPGALHYARCAWIQQVGLVGDVAFGDEGPQLAGEANGADEGKEESVMRSMSQAQMA